MVGRLHRIGAKFFVKSQVNLFRSQLPEGHVVNDSPQNNLLLKEALSTTNQILERREVVVSQIDPIEQFGRLGHPHPLLLVKLPFGEGHGKEMPQ